ncbi:ATP-binding cassette domain-containing protein [Natronoglomus mannanivorans]|uniref:ATP-binding cassette domain-containing protein n=1 Tax=Natronoglomus mannanivorans TaxID=2979990 RepID=A0AAP3E4B8_9EURY|nr:ATP-binding cassette domain-containing protein [Halobacteria archaeon AArc-xg1-1]
MADGDVVLEMEGITKTFGEIVALDDVDLTLHRGEILGLAGDNGAGKSTLIKCLSGAYEPDSGRIVFEGEDVTIENPREAKALGIETTFQELALAPNLSVTQNVFLGREETQRVLPLVPIMNKGAMEARTRELLSDLEIGVDPDKRVSDLSGGQRQLVAISRTMLSDPEIVIMDEPTSALSVEAADRVLELIERMRREGASIILISHNFEHMRAVADRIQILHTGRDVGVLDVEEATRENIVDLMVSGTLEGREGDDSDPSISA